jgi:hypothetical protein
VEIDITNNSNAALDVLLKKVEGALVPGSQNTFCWGLCFPPFIYVAPDPITIPAGTTNESDFSGHYNPYGNTGESTISYVFWDEANPLDSVMVTVIFNGILTGTNEISSGIEMISEAYPNPAVSEVNFNLNLNEDALPLVMKIFNSGGALVRESLITDIHENINISVEGLNEGIYFYQIVNNYRLASGRFVITK